MALTKAQKQKIVEDLKERIERQKMMVFFDFTGLKGKELFELRKKLKTSESELRVAKKTLLKLVFEKEGLKIDTEKLKGEIAVAFGFKDEISAAKIVHQFQKKHKLLKILGGFFENEFKGAQDIVFLANLPTKEELLAILVGTINAPLFNLVNVLQGNIRNLVYIISQIKPST